MYRVCKKQNTNYSHKSQNVMNRYDKQIEHLTKYPAEIPLHWGQGVGLFKVIGAGLGLHAGCLTTIRDADPLVMDKAYINGVIDEDITNAIKNDERLPKKNLDIKIEHLPIFKEWQEKIDKL